MAGLNFANMFMSALENGQRLNQQTSQFNQDIALRTESMEEQASANQDDLTFRRQQAEIANQQFNTQQGLAQQQLLLSQQDARARAADYFSRDWVPADFARQMGYTGKTTSADKIQPFFEGMFPVPEGEYVNRTIMQDALSLKEKRQAQAALDIDTSVLGLLPSPASGGKLQKLGGDMAFGAMDRAGTGGETTPSTIPAGYNAGPQDASAASMASAGDWISKMVSGATNWKSISNFGHLFVSDKSSKSTSDVANLTDPATKWQYGMMDMANQNAASATYSPDQIANFKDAGVKALSRFLGGSNTMALKKLTGPAGEAYASILTNSIAPSITSMAQQDPTIMKIPEVQQAMKLMTSISAAQMKKQQDAQANIMLKGKYDMLGKIFVRDASAIQAAYKNDPTKMQEHLKGLQTNYLQMYGMSPEDLNQMVSNASGPGN